MTHSAEKDAGSIVCHDYPYCDREHAGGAGGVPVHPPAGARISGCDGPLIPDEKPLTLTVVPGSEHVSVFRMIEELDSVTAPEGTGS